MAVEPEPLWKQLNHRARQLLENKDYAGLHATLEQLEPLMPGNPRITYNLAATEAVLGQPDRAIAHLKNLAAAGISYDLSKDDDFRSLAGRPDFAAVSSALIENGKTEVKKGTFVATIAGTDLLPEDLTYDGKTQRWFFSSIRQQRIVTTDGKLFAQTTWSPLALFADVPRRTLWATEGWIPHCPHCAASDKDKTALLAFDLDTGALKQRIPSPVPGLLGDMTVAPDGTVYVAEGIYGAVLRLKPGAAALDRLDRAGEFPSPQNPALSADGNTLYVADYARGIAAINLRTGTLSWKQTSPDVIVSGIDGLYFHGGRFIAVQNGTVPARILEFSSDLKHQTVLEQNTPGLGQPTHGAIVDGYFYFLADTGWDQFNDDGSKKAGASPVVSELRKIKLAS